MKEKVEISTSRTICDARVSDNPYIVHISKEFARIFYYADYLSSSVYDFGNALHYDGTNDYDLTAFSTMSASATKWTWKIWFKLDVNGTYTLYSHYNNASRRRTITVSNTNIVTNIRNGINSVQTYTGAIALNTWYCLFVVFDGTQSTDATRIKFYLGKVGTDANLVDVTLSFTLATPTVLSTIDGTSAIYWGSFLNAANWLNGWMDERAMWSNALSYAQCDTMYNGGNGATNLATDCVFYQKLNESGTTTTAVEEISALNTTLTGFNFDANDGWGAH